jgi:hypothetical protein
MCRRRLGLATSHSRRGRCIRRPLGAHLLAAQPPCGNQTAPRRAFDGTLGRHGGTIQSDNRLRTPTAPASPADEGSRPSSRCHCSTSAATPSPDDDMGKQVESHGICTVPSPPQLQLLPGRLCPRPARLHLPWPLLREQRGLRQLRRRADDWHDSPGLEPHARRCTWIAPASSVGAGGS